MVRWLFVLVFSLSLWVGTSSVAQAGCIDVETFSAKQLEEMKGVGPALSKAIVDYRKAQRTAATKAGKPKWNFKNWATLMKVKGISAKVCADNIGKVCFSGKVQKSCPAK